MVHANNLTTYRLTKSKTYVTRSSTYYNPVFASQPCNSEVESQRKFNNLVHKFLMTYSLILPSRDQSSSSEAQTINLPHQQMGVVLKLLRQLHTVSAIEAVCILVSPASELVITNLPYAESTLKVWSCGLLDDFNKITIVVGGFFPYFDAGLIVI